MSEIGSVIFLEPESATGFVARGTSHVARVSTSPRTLGNPGDIPFERQLAEAQPAEGKLPEVGARAAAALAAVAEPHLELRDLGFLRDLGGCGHSFLLSLYAFLKGIPRSCKSFRDSSSVRAVVTTEIFMPRALSTFM